jgi:hypothetical protein
LQSRTGSFVLNLLPAFANKLIYRRQCSSSFVSSILNPKRKKAFACLFPELVRQSAQAAALRIEFNSGMF